MLEISLTVSSSLLISYPTPVPNSRKNQTNCVDVDAGVTTIDTGISPEHLTDNLLRKGEEKERVKRTQIAGGTCVRLDTNCRTTTVRGIHIHETEENKGAQCVRGHPPKRSVFLLNIRS